MDLGPPPIELNALRKALQTMTDTSSVGEHAGHIQGLLRSHSHEIEVMDWPNDPAKSTCGVYALGFDNWGNYRNYAKRGPFAGADLIKWLLQQKCLVPSGHIVKDSLVLYFDKLGADLVWKHIGHLISPDRVESKWGTGLVLRHSIWEVPSSYGQVAEAFAPITEKDARHHFERYVREEWSPSISQGLPAEG